MEAQVRPLIMAILRFIQIIKPLLPLKPLSEGAPEPPYFELPHAVIEPSALRAAKAYPFE
jgi:hypothetical protein